eukprot:403367355
MGSSQQQQQQGYPYPFNTHVESSQGLKQIVKYERHPHLDPFMIQRMIKPKQAYEFRSTKDSADEKLYDRSLRDPTSTLKTSGSMSMLPRDYFQRYTSNQQNAKSVQKNDSMPYLNNPNFYSPQQSKMQENRFKMQKYSEQQLALKMLGDQAILPVSQYFEGNYGNHHQAGKQMFWDQTYNPRDNRYNKNHDEFGFGIKTWKLNEDMNVRKILELDKVREHKDIFHGAIDYSKGTCIAPLRNFNGNDNLNAALQLLFSVYPMTHYILNDHYKQDLNEDNSRYKDKNAPQFQYGDLFGRIREDVGIPQSDPFEILRFLIECLHEEINRVKVKPPYQNDIEIPRTMLTNIDFISEEYWAYFKKREDSIITDLFTGQMHCRSKCLSCKWEKDSFFSFNDLSLDIFNNNADDNQDTKLQHGKGGIQGGIFEQEQYLYDLMQQLYVSKEELRKCTSASGCANSVIEGPHQVTQQVWRFPIILIIHLQRFKPHQTKSTAPVSFPLERFDMTVGCKKSTHVTKIPAQKYKLFGILHHQGDQATGRYWSEVLNQNEQRWYKCEDALVQAKDDQPSCERSKSAYILTYYRTNR